MKKIKAVIFDWAGTTVDYGCMAPVQAFVEVFKQYGIEPTMEEVRKPMGMLKIDHIRTMLQMERIRGLWVEKYGKEPGEEEAQALYSIFEEKLLSILPDHSGVKPGVVETVNRWLNVGLSAEQIKTVTVFMNPLLRKLAHASEYAALAVVFAFGYQMMKQKRSKVVNFFYAVIMCGLIAVMDELLQKYVFFRTGRALDIAIDLCGAIAGGCVYVFLSELFDFLAGSEE